jgi:hypothetical protein
MQKRVEAKNENLVSVTSNHGLIVLSIVNARKSTYQQKTPSFRREFLFTVSQAQLPLVE